MSEVRQMTTSKRRTIILAIALGIVAYAGMQVIGVAFGQTQQQPVTQLLAQKNIQVLYESPKSLILSGEGTDRHLSLGANRTISHMGEAIDIAKANGFTIDAITAFTEESAAIGNTRYLTPVYTVFMSK